MIIPIPLLANAVNLNPPGRYLHWSIFTVSVANLVLIAVMVVIFGLALVLPFPGRRHAEEADFPAADIGPEATTPNSTDDTSTRKMWTARIRTRALSMLPPGKLLPDRQPAYVSSWVYVFGVTTLVALGIAIVSGFAIALGGPDWWHTNPVGHFFNSLHLWSVELFMAFMVIHLWGKFWMAAWRGRRALTWVTGVVAFVASVVECFTGYLSQQNFDSQWISTNGKDAINATGLGAFFNLMNFGQMLLWHVVLIPIVLVAIVGAHVLLVRVRGVSHPLPTRPARGRAARRTAKLADGAEWRGPMRRYDIVKEATVASVIALLLVVLLSALLSSPDAPPVTVASWAKVAPADFMATAASELAGTSETASYGPPYNRGSNNVQRIGFSWQLLAGVRQPINAAQTFVLSPLSKVSPTDSALARALGIYETAGGPQRQSWDQAYLKAVDHVTFRSGEPVLPAANDGPVPVLVSTELTLARSGALDADLLAQHPFYGTDFTKPLLFLEDGSYFSSLATAQHLTGAQWGVMNETGSYPGQPWLWLYTLWYQVPGFRSSANVDLIAIYLTGVGTLLLLAVPFLPGLRDIPRWIPVHRLVWRSWNKRQVAALRLAPRFPPPRGQLPIDESFGSRRPFVRLRPWRTGSRAACWGLMALASSTQVDQGGHGRRSPDHLNRECSKRRAWLLTIASKSEETMTYMTDQSSRGPSVWERELWTHLTNHVTTERDLLEKYSAVAEHSHSKAFGYLVNLLIEDEIRHHRIFNELAQSLESEASLSSDDPTIPYPDFDKVDVAVVRENTEELLESEERDARELKRLQREMRVVKDGTLWSLLVDLMRRDTEKHIALLRFVKKHAS